MREMGEMGFSGATPNPVGSCGLAGAGASTCKLALRLARLVGRSSSPTRQLQLQLQFLSRSLSIRPGSLCILHKRVHAHATRQLIPRNKPCVFSRSRHPSLRPSRSCAYRRLVLSRMVAVVDAYPRPFPAHSNCA